MGSFRTSRAHAVELARGAPARASRAAKGLAPLTTRQPETAENGLEAAVVEARAIRTSLGLSPSLTDVRVLARVAEILGVVGDRPGRKPDGGGQLARRAPTPAARSEHPQHVARLESKSALVEQPLGAGLVAAG